MKAVNENVDLAMSQISEPKEIPIYFVCSEGLGRSTQAQLKLNHFVYALKSQKELVNNVSEVVQKKLKELIEIYNIYRFLPTQNGRVFSIQY